MRPQFATQYGICPGDVLQSHHAGRPVLLSKDTSSAEQSADAMWQAVTADAFIKTLVGPPVKTHYFLSNPDEAAAALTTSRRAAFLDLLIKNPSLLDVLDAKQAVRFFEPFRIGTPAKALDVFGTWASRNPDMICDFSTDRVFNGDQRYAFASMAIFVTQQVPGQAATLQSQYLQLPDGRCSLPVAYTLACSYLGQKKFADWLAFLDAKLADKSLTGDLRVNWLLARANAEELDPMSISHYPSYYGVPGYSPLNGQKYLDQALQSAVSPAVKVRVAREIIGHLTWKRDFAAAKAILQSISGALPDDQKAIVASLQQQLDEFARIDEEVRQNQPALAKKAHRDELKRRREQAAKRGDTAAVTRYDNLIGAATDAQ